MSSTRHFATGAVLRIYLFHPTDAVPLFRPDPGAPPEMWLNLVCVRRPLGRADVISSRSLLATSRKSSGSLRPLFILALASPPSFSFSFIVALRSLMITYEHSLVLASFFTLPFLLSTTLYHLIPASSFVAFFRRASSLSRHVSYAMLSPNMCRRALRLHFSYSSDESANAKTASSILENGLSKQACCITVYTN